MSNVPAQWAFTCHLDLGGEGAVRVVRRNAAGFEVTAVPVAADDADQSPAPVFLGATGAGEVMVMDSAGGAVSSKKTYPAAALAPYAYPEAGTRRLWFTIDGDKETGSDPLRCQEGAPILVVDAGAPEPAAMLQSLICVGRGHHVVTFTAPCEAHPRTPRLAFVSNLLDGSISVLGNDPDDPASYLQVVDSIDLSEPAREKEGISGVPNNAFPHGKVFSPRTGKVYNLNNGYGTIAVIDPGSRRIEDRIELKVSSNLLLSPCGRYLVGKGADRKSDPDHVLGRLSVVDAVAGKVVTTLDLPDVYPSTYRFSPDGSRLYVTTAATGKGAQRGNLKIDRVFVYEASALPELRLVRELEVGKADCSRRPVGFVRDPGGDLVLVPNPTDGTLSVLRDADGTVVETLRLHDGAVREFNFCFWDGVVSGC